MDKRSLLKWILAGLAGIILAAGLGFVIWAEAAAGPDPAAAEALESDRFVLVEEWEGWVFQPRDGAAVRGLILYPGGRVAPASYAPLARAIAGEGFLVAIPEMPLNLAVFNPGAAGKVIDRFPEVEIWVVGGHSLGGAMAAQYAARNLDKVEGLVLWASYPAERLDLSEADLAVISIYASRDGLASPEEVLSSQSRLPSDAEFVEITGGNHAGFSYYGPQRGDQQAKISQEEQTRLVVKATLELLISLGD